jgi:hypothetical protein
LRPLPSYHPETGRKEGESFERHTNRKYRAPKQGRSRKAHTVALHDTEELDDDLGARSDEHLALASLLSVVAT